MCAGNCWGVTWPCWAKASFWFSVQLVNEKGECVAIGEQEYTGTAHFQSSGG